MGRLSEDRGVYQDDFRVRYSESDFTGVMKIRSMFDYLQETAGTHAGHLGIGWKVMRENHLVWVLSRLKIVFERSVEQGELLTVTTCPNGFDRIFARRQFDVTDEAGRPVARASSLWLALSLEKMRPAKLSEGGLFDFPMLRERPDHFPGLGKLVEDPALPELFSVEVRNSRIDLNEHLNNAEYAALLHDAIYFLTRKAVRIAELQINFTAAQKEGARIVLFGKVENNTFRVRAEGVGGVECFQAEGRLFPCES